VEQPSPALKADKPPVLPRRVADIQLSPAVKAALDEKGAKYYWGPEQYRAKLDTQLEVYARMAKCMGDRLPYGQVDLKLTFRPSDDKTRRVVVKAIAPQAAMPGVDRTKDRLKDVYELAGYCAAGVIGIEEAGGNPILRTGEAIMYVDVHFPIDSNPLYELLRSGVEPEIEDLTADRYPKDVAARAASEERRRKGLPY
jgi:hypothetical protein